jgi:hypothetical protein
MGGDPKKLREPIERLQELAARAGRAPLEVKLMTTLPLADAGRRIDVVHSLLDAGVTSIIHAARYTALGEFEEAAGRLAECKPAL